MSLKYGSRGPEVRQCKEMLVALGYLRACTHDVFRSETEKAVRAFQRDHRAVLRVDGIIGTKTRAALEKAYSEAQELAGPKITDYLPEAIYKHVPPEIRAAVNLALQDESEIRVKVVQEALRWVYPLGLYVFGANLYDSKDAVQAATAALIDKAAARNPGYFTGGRKDWMKAQIAAAIKAKRQIVCSDCSGYPVGIWRHEGIVARTFDSKAHWLFHTHCKAIAKVALAPADLVFARLASGRIPHTGIYIGAGYVVAAEGGAYGLQITKLDDRAVINQMTGARKTLRSWAAFGSPKYY